MYCVILIFLVIFSGNHTRVKFRIVRNLNNYPWYEWLYIICWCQTQEEDCYCTPFSTATWWWDKTQKAPLPHVPWNTHFTELQPKLMENEDVVCCLRGGVKPPPSIKPKEPSHVNNPVTAFSNILNFLPAQKYIQNYVLRSPTKIIWQLHSCGHAS